MKPQYRAVAGLLAFQLSTAALADVLPRSGHDTGPETTAERSLWTEAVDFDRAMARAGKLNSDPQLTFYLQNIMDRLYPDFVGNFHVHAVNAQEINAFALPNGSVYINTGLLARFENEAQLATVMAHEGAHFLYRHSYQQNEKAKSTSVFGLVVGMLGVPLIGDLIAVSSMFGYSREHEREADKIGYERLVAAGYDPHESTKTFEHLLAEIKASDIKEPFFFASHPKLEERIESFKELSKDARSGKLGKEEFINATATLRLASFEADLAAYRHKQVILVLANPKRRLEYPPEASYYLGEAYRQRNADGDKEKAEREYQIAIEGAPQFAPPYRALGLLCYRKHDIGRAEPLFRRYLELAPSAPDRDYIEAYLAQITSPAPANPGASP